MRVVIIGAGGRLGGALLREYSRERSLTAFNRQQLNLAEPEQLRPKLEPLGFDVLINAAGQTNVDRCETEPDEAFAVNAEAPRLLAEICGEKGARLVHFSTDYVFDGTLRRPLRPDDPVGPQSAYGKSKLLGEQAIQGVTGLDYLVLRTAWLYGTGGANFVKTMVTVAKAGKPLRVINDQFGSPTSTLDLAAATLELLDRDATGILHVSNAGETNWFDFARAIFQEWNLTPDLGPTTSDAWKAQRPESATRPAYSVLDITPFQEAVGHPMRDWRNALAAFKAEVDRSGTF